MSRPLRIEYPGAWYHVMNRGRRHEDIFHSSEDYQTFIAILKETSAEFNLRIAAYCLMPNHYHLLVQTPDGNISRCMRHVNGIYTQRYNRLHDTDGQLFRGRYKAVLVEDDRYLLEVMRYIHKNPVKAGIVDEMADYAWSSHVAYVSQANKWSWLLKDRLLEMLSAKRTAQKKQYLDFIGEKISEEIDLFYSKKKLGSILGSRIYRNEINVKFTNKIFEKEITEAKQLVLDADQIIGAVCKYYDLDKKYVLTGRRGFTNTPRDICMYLLKLYRRDSLNEIGGYFGIASYSTVSSSVQRVRNRLKSEKKLQKDVTGIEKILVKGQ